MWPCAIFNLRDIRLADWLSQFLLDGAHQFQLRHGPTEAAQRAFDFSQVTKFLRQTHSLPLTHIAITILLFAISVKKGMCRELSRLRGYFSWRLQPRFDARTRIEQVAQCVSNEVEGQHGQHHRERRKNDEMSGIEQMCAAIIQHCTPACSWWRNTEAKETHSRFRQDRSCHADCGLHDDRLNNIWKNVPSHDAKIVCTQSARRFNILTLARRNNLCADQARIAHPAAQ